MVFAVEKFPFVTWQNPPNSGADPERGFGVTASKTMKKDRFQKNAFNSNSFFLCIN